MRYVESKRLYEAVACCPRPIGKKAAQLLFPHDNVRPFQVQAEWHEIKSTLMTPEVGYIFVPQSSWTFTPPKVKRGPAPREQ